MTDPGADEELQKGDLALEDWRIRDAKKHYANVLAIEPDNKDARAAFVHASALLLPIEEAERLYASAFDELPNEPRLHYGLGWQYQSVGNYRAALTEFRRAVDLDESYWLAHIGAAGATRGLGDNSAAHQQLVSMPLAWKDTADWHVEFANLALVEARYSEAQKSGEQALRRRPGDSRIVASIGDTLIMQRRYYDAIEFLQKYVDRKPDDSRLLVVLASAYYYANRPRKAIELLDRIQDNLRDSGKALAIRGWALRRMRRYAEAVPVLRQALSKSGGGNQLEHALATCELIMGEDEIGFARLKKLAHERHFKQSARMLLFNQVLMGRFRDALHTLPLLWRGRDG